MREAKKVLASVANMLDSPGVGRLAVQGQEWHMANHPNRSSSNRKIAEAAGYYVREGSYQGTTDDRLGRWYVGKEGELFAPFGAGYPSRAQAWAAAAENVELSRD